MRIAIIGDIHAYQLRLRPRQLVGKRLVGQTNLWLNRRFRFNHSLLEPVLQRVADIEPDLLLFTGDLTTTSLPDEFADMLERLSPLAERIRTLIVPGNHDRYTFGSARRQRIETMLAPLLPAQFPHFEKLHERWHLLALDAARPRVMFSRGRLGQRQLNLTKQHLMQLTADDGLVVICHYPIVMPPRTVPVDWGHEMSDRTELSRLLKACPARVVYLHGHIHRPWCWQPTGGKLPHFTFINAGSPCLTTTTYPMGQGFWQIDLPPMTRQTLGIRHHVPDHENGGSATAWKVVDGHPSKPTNTKWHAAVVR